MARGDGAVVGRRIDVFKTIKRARSGERLPGPNVGNRVGLMARSSRPDTTARPAPSFPLKAREEMSIRDDPLLAVHYLPVMRLCLSRLHDRADAEDATQEVFRRAVQHATKISDDPLPWL